MRSTLIVLLYFLGAPVNAANQFPLRDVPRTYSVGYTFRSLAAEDLDRDGQLDIVSANYVSYGREDGSFEIGEGFGLQYDGIVADIDGDDLLDVLYSERENLVLQRNRGNRDFEESVIAIPVVVRRVLLVGDLTNDGSPDILVRSPHTQLLVNDGRGSFVTRTEEHLHFEGPVASGDFDGDGDLDVIGRDYSSLRIILNDGSGHFSAGPKLADGGSANVFLADLDGDRRTDVVTFRWVSHRWRMAIHRAADGFRETLTTVETAFAPTQGGAADFNNDGAIDLAIVDNGNHEPVRPWSCCFSATDTERSRRRRKSRSDCLTRELRLPTSITIASSISPFRATTFTCP